MEETIDKFAENRALIDGFLKYMKDVQGYSPNTVTTYSNGLQRMEEFLRTHDMSVRDMTFNDAKAFTVGLYDEGLSPASVNMILSANRHFFHSLCEDGILQSQPFKRIASAKDVRKIPTVLAPGEVDMILDSPVTDYSSLLETTMFTMFYSTGCRLSEIVGMKLEDIDIRNRRVLVTGKGDKQRFVFLTQRAIDKLAVYLPERNLVLERTKKKNPYLLVNSKGNQLPVSTVHSIFDKYRDRLGLSKKFTPHVFRHTFATHLIDNDSDIRVVQVLLGHESIGTTQIYTHVTGKRLEEVYRNNHPHGRNDDEF